MDNKIDESEWKIYLGSSEEVLFNFLKRKLGMGQVQSQIDPRHIGIYKKLLAIQNHQTRLPRTNKPSVSSLKAASLAIAQITSCFTKIAMVMKSTNL